MNSQSVFEDQVVQAVKDLPSYKIQEVIKYANFLRWKETKEAKEIVELDEWALNLAKKRGFDRLSEDDVASIVHECRRESR
ncbi:hypothetical protein KJ693_04610 [bacterium]|nr:hypothetical protein [bacterium]MBU1614577.1 hypothetical protein [bacterium]